MTTYNEFSLPEHLAGVPEPIAEANAAYLKAEAEAEEAGRAAADAHRARIAAPDLDRQAMEAAVDGARKVPKPTASAKAEAAEQAEALADAKRARAAKLRREFLALFWGSLDDYLPPRREAAHKAAEPVRETVPRLLADLVGLRSETALLRAVYEGLNNPHPEKAPPGPAADPARLVVRYERALDGKRKAMSDGERRRAAEALPELLADLTVALEAELDVVEIVTEAEPEAVPA